MATPSAPSPPAGPALLSGILNDECSMELEVLRPLSPQELSAGDILEPLPSDLDDDPFLAGLPADWGIPSLPPPEQPSWPAQPWWPTEAPAPEAGGSSASPCDLPPAEAAAASTAGATPANPLQGIPCYSRRSARSRACKPGDSPQPAGRGRQSGRIRRAAAQKATARWEEASVGSLHAKPQPEPQRPTSSRSSSPPCPTATPRKRSRGASRLAGEVGPSSEEAGEPAPGSPTAPRLPSGDVLRLACLLHRYKQLKLGGTGAGTAVGDSDGGQSPRGPPLTPSWGEWLQQGHEGECQCEAVGAEGAPPSPLMLSASRAAEQSCSLLSSGCLPTTPGKAAEPSAPPPPLPHAHTQPARPPIVVMLCNQPQAPSPDQGRRLQDKPEPAHRDKRPMLEEALAALERQQLTLRKDVRQMQGVLRTWAKQGRITTTRVLERLAPAP